METSQTTQKQLTDYTAFDLLAIAPDTQLQEMEFFNIKGKPNNLNNLKLPVSRGVKYKFEYGMLANGLLVKPVGITDPNLTTPAGQQQYLEYQRDFENTSMIVYKIQGVEYPAVPFSSFLSYKIERVGGTYQKVDKPNLQNHVFRDVILVEEGDLNFYFRPASGYQTFTTLASASTLPSITNILKGPGYTLELFLRGEITRPIANYTN